MIGKVDERLRKYADENGERIDKFVELFGIVDNTPAPSFISEIGIPILFSARLRI